MAALVVDSSSACIALRRGLGATAWFVLEELVVRAEVVSHGGLRARGSTREIALSLDLNKDTVTRALARLRTFGVVAVVTRGGVSGASVFAIDVPAGLVIMERGVDVVAVAPRGRRKRSTGEQNGSGSQLSLLS